jgi:PAS domain S-box-containing protein
MEVNQLYNSRLFEAYLRYIKKHHPDIDMESALHFAGITRWELEDEGHWFTQQQANLFNEILEHKTGNPDLAREVGRYATYRGEEIQSVLRRYMMGFITPTTAYAFLGQIANKLSRASTYETKTLGNHKVEVRCVPKTGINEHPFQCENRLGMLESLTRIYTGKNASIEHPECFHKGDKSCRYIITWEPIPSSTWKKIRNYLFLIGLFSCGLSIPFLSPIPWLFLFLSCALTILGLSFQSEHLEKQEYIRNLTTEANTADRLLNEINMRYNDALLIREVGQATSMILNIDDLLKFIIEALEKRLDFDRGLILLADKDQKYLKFVVGYGYDKANEKLMKSLAFHLDKPESRGPAVMSFKTQKPYLINDVSEIEADLSTRTIEFIRFAGTHSFISVPIIYKGESMGTLFVDNVVSKRKLTNSDMSLLMGIAPQIAISINNALSYQKTQESEQRFRSLSENAPDIIYTLDFNGFFTYINPAWEKILDHRTDEVIGRNFTDFLAEPDVAGFIDRFDKIRNEKAVVRDLPLTILHRDGSGRHFTMSGAPNLDSQAEIIGLVGTLKDVTEQRSLEDQLRHATKMEAVGTLTSGIAHDFNNIMQAISGYNQLLMMRKSEDDPDWKYLANINQLIQRSSELIKQLLIFSRKVDSKFEPISLSQEIEKFYELMARSISRMIAVHFDMADDLRIISGDRAQLGQVIMNLAINAADAMPDGGEITISTRNVHIDRNRNRYNVPMKKGFYVLIRFSDTGQGIDKKTLDHIFEPFFTTKEVGKGTGLGLSVVYGIVKNHGGYITCESEQGIGTIFSIYLPALEQPYQEEEAGRVTEEQDLTGKETVLLVDDEKYLLEGGQDILNHFGYKALVAETGETALEIFKKEHERIDLVIMDLIMPGMGGLKCLSELLKIDPGTKVVIASGYASNVKKNELLKNGAVGFVQKPYHLQDLLREIRRVIDGVA